MFKVAVEKEQVAIIYISALKMEGENLACDIANISFSTPITLLMKVRGKKREEEEKMEGQGGGAKNRTREGWKGKRTKGGGFREKVRKVAGMEGK